MIRSRSGFALPLVLAMVAILTLTTAVCIVSLRGLKEQTRLAKSGVEFQQAAMTAEARFAYLMTTEPFGAATLDIGGNRTAAAQGQTTTVSAPTAQIHIDNRPYLWRNDVTITDGPAFITAVQDEAGLINLYQSDALQLQRLFEWAGLESGEAEDVANEIIEYNLDPTAHQPMRRPAEIYRLQGVVDLIPDKIWRKVASRATIYSDNRAVNINTAPAEVLKIWFDLSDTQAEQIVRDREDVVLTSTADIGVVVPNQNRNYALTGGRVRFTFSDPDTGLSYQSSLVLTPNSATRPVWIENQRVLRLLSPPEITDDLEDFPSIPDPAA